jgi:hypothetical protein
MTLLVVVGNKRGLGKHRIVKHLIGPFRICSFLQILERYVLRWVGETVAGTNVRIP